MLCSNECTHRQLQTVSYIITLFALWIHLYALRHSSHLAWWKYSDAPSALHWDTCCSLQPELDRVLCRGIPLALVSVETCPAALLLCAFIFFPRLRWQKIAIRIILWQKINLWTILFSVKECSVFSFCKKQPLFRLSVVLESKKWLWTPQLCSCIIKNRIFSGK